MYCITRSTPARMEGNSSGQSACGMSGRAPTPFQAISNLIFGGFVQRAQIGVYVQSLAPFSHHKIDKPEGLLGSRNKTVSDYYLGLVFGESSLDTRSVFRGEPDETCESQQQIVLYGRHQSISTYYAGPVPARYESRKHGRSDPRLLEVMGLLAATVLCIFESSIFGGYVNPASLLHTERKKGFQSCQEHVTF